MALKSFRVTKKELETYYNPKTSNYTLMVNSINSNGYGQIIEQYIGSEVLNTYYNIWDTNTNSMVVYDKIQNMSVPDADAGPVFFGVSGESGVKFLSGDIEISGLRKLKYCDTCSDGNGLKKPVIENFKQRFTQVKELVLNYNLLEGFLFYDRDLPKYQDVFPAVKFDDGVNVTYQFKNVNGTDLTVNDVSTITGKPVTVIEASVDTAPIIKPQEGANTVIVSCCDEKVFYVIPGQYSIGGILYSNYFPESFCWYAESLTKNLPNVGAEAVFTSGGRSCAECVKINGCPSPCEPIILAYSYDPNTICDGQNGSSGGLVYNDYLVNWSNGSLYLNGSCGDMSPPSGYYFDGKIIYEYTTGSLVYWGQCTSSATSSLLTDCCGYGNMITISGVYPLGAVLYTKDTDPAECWQVIENNNKEPDNFYSWNIYEGGCKDCIGTYGSCR